MIHRHISIVHQGRNVVSQFTAQGNAKRDGHIDGIVFKTDRGAEIFDHARRKGADAIPLPGFERHHTSKFIAAKARHDAPGRHNSAKRVSDRHQKMITGTMTIIVVHQLEVIQIDHEKGDFATVFGPVLKHLRCLHTHAATIEATGKRVGIGQFAGKFFGIAPIIQLAQHFAVSAPAEND